MGGISAGGFRAGLLAVVRATMVASLIRCFVAGGPGQGLPPFYSPLPDSRLRQAAVLPRGGMIAAPSRIGHSSACLHEPASLFQVTRPGRKARRTASPCLLGNWISTTSPRNKPGHAPWWKTAPKAVCRLLVLGVAPAAGGGIDGVLRTPGRSFMRMPGNRTALPRPGGWSSSMICMALTAQRNNVRAPAFILPRGCGSGRCRRPSGPSQAPDLAGWPQGKTARTA